MSGANIRLLNGLQDALRSAFTRPVPFEAIVVDQLSRLSRDVGDADSLIKRLRFSGVRVIAVPDGIDTADDTTKVSVTSSSATAGGAGFRLSPRTTTAVAIMSNPELVRMTFGFAGKPSKSL